MSDQLTLHSPTVPLRPTGGVTIAPITGAILHKMDNKTYINAIELADQYMSTDPEAGDVTSCLKQAASDCGIGWGTPMREFIDWAHEEFGL